MIREMTNNGNNTRRPLCYLTARLSYAWTQRRTVTDKEGKTDRETDRGTRGTEWDPICNTKPSKAAVVDDCHARITGRSGLNRAGPGRRCRRQHQDFKLLLLVRGRRTGFLLQYRQHQPRPSSCPQCPHRRGREGAGRNSGSRAVPEHIRRGARRTKMIADATLMTDVDSWRSIRAVNKYSTDRLPYRRELCPPGVRGRGAGTTQ